MHGRRSLSRQSLLIIHFRVSILEIICTVESGKAFLISARGNILSSDGGGLREEIYSSPKAAGRVEPARAACPSQDPGVVIHTIETAADTNLVLCLWEGARATSTGKRGRGASMRQQ